MSEFLKGEKIGDYPLQLLAVALASGLLDTQNFEVVKDAGQGLLIIIQADPRIKDFLEQMIRRPGLSLLLGLTGLDEKELTSVFSQQSARKVYEGETSVFSYTQPGSLRDEIERRARAWFSERGRDYVSLKLPFPSFYILTQMLDFLSLVDPKTLERLIKNGEAYGISKGDFLNNLLHLIRSGLLVPDPENQIIRPATLNELGGYTFLRDLELRKEVYNAFQRAGAYFVEPLKKLPDDYIKVERVGDKGIAALRDKASLSSLDEDCQRFVEDFVQLVYSLP